MQRVVAGALLALSVLLAAACGEAATGPNRLRPTGPTWWEGTWNAVSIDGQPLPATQPSYTSSIRYDSLSIRIGASTIHSFSYRATLLGSTTLDLGCSGLVSIERGETSVRISGPNQLNTCPFLQLYNRQFARSGDDVIHEWEGHRWVLRRAP